MQTVVSADDIKMYRKRILIHAWLLLVVRVVLGALMVLPFQIGVWNGLCHSKLSFGMALHSRKGLCYNPQHG